MTTAGQEVPAQEVDQAFRAAWQRLEEAGIETARTDARLLLGYVLGGGAERVLAEKGRMLSADEAAQFETLVQRRLHREPISYIRGTREFWSLDFKVTNATLTPRPDTETLIEAVLDHASNPPATLLDLGTGTGCIVLALLSEWKECEGVGVDASAEALAVARENAQALGMETRARFVHADWNDAAWAQQLGGPFDVVVSNPPYIPEGDIAGLDEDVRGFEPLSALVGGADGLDAYRVILQSAPALVAPGGLLGFEVGINQAEGVAALMEQAGLTVMEIRKDLGGVERCVIARNAADN